MRLRDVSRSVNPVPDQRAGFAAGADHRDGTTWLVEQVSDLAKVVDAVLAQQRIHVRVRQPGAGQLSSMELAAGGQDTGRMVDEADEPSVPAQDRDKAVRGQEGEQRDRRGSERRVRCGRAPADDRADRDGNREIESAELGQRAPFA